MLNSGSFLQSFAGRAVLIDIYDADVIFYKDARAGILVEDLEAFLLSVLTQHSLCHSRKGIFPVD